MTLNDSLTPNLLMAGGIAINATCGMPSATTMQMPSMSATAVAALPNANPNATLTIQDLNQRLPSIVNSTPTVIAKDDCDGFTAWVRDNPLMAALGLAAVAYFALGKK